MLPAMPWHAGAVAVFVRVPGARWVFRQRLQPPPAVRRELEARHAAGDLYPDERFGSALVADGARARVVIGCPGAAAREGRVYVFDQEDGHSMRLTATLEPPSTAMLALLWTGAGWGQGQGVGVGVPPSGSGGHFGASLSLSMQEPGQDWAISPSEQAGAGEAISEWSIHPGEREVQRRQRAGRVLAIGAPGALGNRGIAVIRVEAIPTKGLWSAVTESTAFVAPSAGPAARFGTSVAVLGSVLAVGAPGWKPNSTLELYAAAAGGGHGTAVGSRNSTVGGTAGVRTGAAFVFRKP